RATNSRHCRDPSSLQLTVSVAAAPSSGAVHNSGGGAYGLFYLQRLFRPRAPPSKPAVDIVRTRSTEVAPKFAVSTISIRSLFIAASRKSGGAKTERTSKNI